MKTVSKLLLALTFIAAGFYLQNCGTTTKVMGSWTNPETSGNSYSKVMVVGLTSNIVARRNVEDQLVAALQKEGINAMASINVFTPNFMQKQPSKEEILNQIRKDGYDGVLTVALLDERTESRYVPGSTMYAPVSRYGYYGSFGGYYSTMYATHYDPGYYTTDKTYVVETNLYDASSETLVWSAQTETYDPSNPETGARSLSLAIADKMDRDGVLK
ncbi:hypothetical protein [Fulvivirga sedimenti]|uniref:DUF4136 domain-containing protein n=1 Tax=Fulvivirga sedimenti TaxID=2879465 RepID=A0A9X1HW64_9BACT|nr:hypothetical protein [Fulvivirga sedimenti]MCA6079050.1 hypothetical protein [Fulvivirga sedimenti]